MTIATQSPLFGPAIPTGRDEWYTPPWVFDAAGLRFDLDVCAPTDPSFRGCPADKFYTIEDDGLSQPWHGLVWCNPPYSHSAPWVERWANHPDGLLLVPTTPEVRWRRELIRADAIALVTVSFIRADGGRGRIAWTNTVAARGAAAVGAVGRIAAADQYSAGAYWVKPNLP